MKFISPLSLLDQLQECHVAYIAAGLEYYDHAALAGFDAKRAELEEQLIALGHCKLEMTATVTKAMFLK